MNRSPEIVRVELEAEQRLTANDRPPSDPALAADWRLRQTLRGLGDDSLPPDLRDRVMQATRPPLRPARWLALAAAVALAVAVGVFLEPEVADPPENHVSQQELQDLQMALAMLEHSARRTTEIAGRELASSLTAPDLHLDSLPYATQFRQAIQPSKPRTDQ